MLSKAFTHTHTHKLSHPKFNVRGAFYETDECSIEQSGSGLKATLEDGSTLEADVIMYATGRKPRTEDLGLEKAGIKTDKNGAIVVRRASNHCFARPFERNLV